MKKRSYDLEFKRTIVELIVSGKRVSEVCKEYNLGISMVNRWRREFTKNSTGIKSTQQISEEQKEIANLRKELREITMERDILKKAVSIFSKSGR